ncbi:SMP-30/gluconolactonase/LRE family protein [Nocardioidaceae bacterium]|nr:SMP-30/gluconolactonase/LRE family protein [Nocardioidaceae bacterium]
MLARTTTGAPTVVPVPGNGCEDVLVDTAGRVLTGTDDGIIHRVDPDTGTCEVLARTRGRPLGLEWLPDGRLLVCDASKGVLAVDVETGRVRTLVGLVMGRPMRFCNNATVASNGDVWFTDSSTEHGVEGWKHDLAEHTCTGRLLRLRPDGTVTVELEGLAFANGVVMARDESFVAVAQTGRREVTRYWLTGRRAGQTDALCEDLPGYPDNLSRHEDRIWITLASPRDRTLEILQHRMPLGVRRAALRLPQRLQPGVRRTARALAVDDQGRTQRDIDLDAGSFHMVTGAREHEGRLWLGSLVEPAVAVVDL